MTDPVRSPLTPEDNCYGDIGPPSPNAQRQARSRRADPDQTKDAARAVSERERNDLAAVLATDAGQRFLLRVLGECDPYSSSIRFGHADASAFQEGKRAVALWLIQALTRLDPECYPKLLLANVKRVRADEGASAAMAAQSSP